MMSTCPCLSTCAGGPEACAQVTSPKQQGALALSRPNPLLQCLLRGPPQSPNATQRTLLQAIPSSPHHFLWRNTAASLWASSCLPLLRPHPCRLTYHLLHPANTYRPTTSTISTPTPIRCPNPYQCFSIHRARPMSLPSARLPYRCTS